MDDEDLLITPFRLCVFFTFLVLASIVVVIGFYINWLIVRYNGYFFASNARFIIVITQLTFVLLVLSLVDIVLYYKKNEINQVKDENRYLTIVILNNITENKLLFTFVLVLMTFSFSMILSFFDFIVNTNYWGIAGRSYGTAYLIFSIIFIIVLILSIIFFSVIYYKRNSMKLLLPYLVTIVLMSVISFSLSIPLAMFILFGISDNSSFNPPRVFGINYLSIVYSMIVVIVLDIAIILLYSLIRNRKQ